MRRVLIALLAGLVLVGSAFANEHKDHNSDYQAGYIRRNRLCGYGSGVRPRQRRTVWRRRCKDEEHRAQCCMDRRTLRPLHHRSASSIEAAIF
jgi:hypothetical protein